MHAPCLVAELNPMYVQDVLLLLCVTNLSTLDMSIDPVQ